MNMTAEVGGTIYLSTSILNIKTELQNETYS